MKKISGLTNDVKQKFVAVIDGYDAATITLEYKSQQYAWYMSVVWGDFAIYGERVAVSYNLLRQFRDILPFGIAVSGVDAMDPLFKDSWLSANSFFILDSTDIETVEALYVR